MTTDEIKALIAQTIEGQGDAVDVGGGLAKILNTILDNLGAKLVQIKGVINSDNKFVPYSGSPTLSETIEAMLEGKIIQFALFDESGEYVGISQLVFLSYSPDYDNYILIEYAADDKSLDNVIWE